MNTVSRAVSGDIFLVTFNYNLFRLCGNLVIISPIFRITSLALLSLESRIYYANSWELGTTYLAFVDYLFGVISFVIFLFINISD